MRKHSNKEWIDYFKIVHKDKYDYSKTNCENRDEKGRICIICPIHGEFWQTPSNHKNGQGCRKCMGEKLSLLKRSNNNEFISNANIIHNNKYVYTSVEYINNWTKVLIKCPIHGEFWQTPHNHLQGAGCPECKKLLISNANKYSLDEFIEKANVVHNNKYIYSETEYKDIYTPIKIICPKHGIFIQTPRDHLQGCGCQKCKSSKMELDINQFLIGNNINFEYQKHFEWLGKQSLDFYLPHYNIAIECQGEQHFIPSTFGSKLYNGEEMLDYIQSLDKRKLTLCQEHGIQIIYYSNLKTITPHYSIITNTDQLLLEIKKYGKEKDN